MLKKIDVFAVKLMASALSATMLVEFARGSVSRAFTCGFVGVLGWFLAMDMESEPIADEDEEEFT